MAIRTGDIFNSLVFGGVNSADYGIYITGEAVFNAPSRAVETVSVPGRNGDIIIDQGHWENIKITYPAGTFGMNETQFKTALSNFRNAIVSQLGYQRLSDTYHPEEYRMGTYVEGLEVDTKSHNKAGEFDLIFNCKPQRWLTEGETAVTVESGDTLTNPTLYDAGPLLIVEGYGTISFNGNSIKLDNAVLGNVEIEQAEATRNIAIFISIKNGLLVDGDAITIRGISETGYLSTIGSGIFIVSSVTDSNSSFGTVKDERRDRYTTSCGKITLTAGTAETVSNLTTFTGTHNGTTKTVQRRLSVVYRPNHYSDGRDAIEIRVGEYEADTVKWDTVELMHGNISAYSTKNILGHPTFIDCESGNAYSNDNGTFVNLNGHIDLGSNLPKLKNGENDITYTDTVTDLKVVPGWWQL